ncbi:MAG: hypothetical protein AAB569_06830 [Patescibacteria group bacterium]
MPSERSSGMADAKDFRASGGKIARGGKPCAPPRPCGPRPCGVPCMPGPCKPSPCKHK